MRTMLTRTLLALTAALGLAAQHRAAAQCNGTPDGLDNGVPCAIPPLSVPLNKATTTALGICWRDCGVDATDNYTAEWGLPSPFFKVTWPAPACGWYTVRLRLHQANVNKWVGNLRMVYSRTFMEANPVAQYQVWRFLVNGDMTPLAPGNTPCAKPACAVAFGNRVRFTGYIDYAFNCVNGQYEYAWMISHVCDRIDHAPGGPRAGVFHPDRSYTFVGPSAGFAIGAAATVENGMSTFESVRRWDTSVGIPLCNFDEPVANHGIFAANGSCLCGFGGPQWSEAFMSGSGVWGTSWNATVVGTTNFMSMNVGAWTNFLTYPGQEELRWNAADIAYVDPCSGGNPTAEFFYGVTTTGGNFAFPVQNPVVSLPTQFIDMSNSKRLPAFTTIRNVPYWSDHLLNLNL